LLWVKQLVGVTLIAAAVGGGLLTMRSTAAARERAEAAARAETARQAARTQADLRAVENKAQSAAELPSLNAALATHVDSATIIDLLDTEDWWRAYRSEFPVVRLMVGDKIVATRGASGGVSVETDLVKTARRRMVASAQAALGNESYLLGAARFTSLS